MVWLHVDASCAVAYRPCLAWAPCWCVVKRPVSAHCRCVAATVPSRLYTCVALPLCCSDCPVKVVHLHSEAKKFRLSGKQALLDFRARRLSRKHIRRLPSKCVVSSISQPRVPCPPIYHFFTAPYLILCCVTRA